MARGVSVYITPVINQGAVFFESIYGDEVEVTEYVESVGGLERFTERQDGEAGNFDYDNFEVTFNNFEGRFNQPFPETDGRTFFPYERDKTKIRVAYRDDDDNETTVFEGLLNEEVSGQTLYQDSAKFQFRSLSAELSQQPIVAGLIVSGGTFSDAIKRIFNRPAITSVLTFDPDLIALGVDVIVDDTAFFQRLNSKDALDELLLASHSIFYVNNDSALVVTTRDTTGPQSLVINDDDIISIRAYRDGRNKTFNQISIANGVVRDNRYINQYGLREKRLERTNQFITDEGKQFEIANFIVNNSKIRYHEFEVEIELEQAINIDLMDSVQLSFDGLIRKPKEQAYLPTYGQPVYGSVVYPLTVRGFRISPSIYRVIGINHDLTNLRTVLTLQYVESV